MTLLSHTLPCFRANHLFCVLIGKTANTNVFGLTRLGLELTFCHSLQIFKAYVYLFVIVIEYVIAKGYLLSEKNN